MEAIQQFLAVIFVFCLLGLTLWVGRGRTMPGFPSFMSKNATPRPIECAGRLVLTPQHALHLVRLGGREILIATHPHGCTLVSESQPSQKGAGA